MSKDLNPNYYLGNYFFFVGISYHLDREFDIFRSSLHFLLTCSKMQGIDDALIQPYSGHESLKSLEIYSKLAITDARQEYKEVINKFLI